mgnify:CR=1 FL=1
MANIDVVSLNGNNFVNLGTQGIKALIAANTDTEVVNLDLCVGPAARAGASSTTDCIFVLKEITILQGTSFTWNDNGVIFSPFNTRRNKNLRKHNGSAFVDLTDQTFLVRASSAGQTIDLLIRRS